MHKSFINFIFMISNSLFIVGSISCFNRRALISHRYPKWDIAIFFIIYFILIWLLHSFEKKSFYNLIYTK